jgi:hypothetical protein
MTDVSLPRVCGVPVGVVTPTAESAGAGRLAYRVKRTELKKGANATQENAT